MYIFYLNMKVLLVSWLFPKIACLDKIWLLSCPKTSRPIRMQDSLNYNNSQTSWDMKLNFCMWLDVHRSNAIQSFQVGVVRHTWNPPPLYLGRWGEGGGDFVRPWGTLNFYLPLGGGGLAKRGVYNFSHFLRGTSGFSLLGDGGSPSLSKILLIPFPSGKFTI